MEEKDSCNKAVTQNFGARDLMLLFFSSTTTALLDQKSYNKNNSLKLNEP